MPCEAYTMDNVPQLPTAAPQTPRCRSTARPTRLSLLHRGMLGRQPRGRERAIGQMPWPLGPTALNSENHKAAAPCLAKFRVCAASRALGGMGQGNARSRFRPCKRLPVTGHRADVLGVGNCSWCWPQHKFRSHSHPDNKYHV